MSRSRRRRAQPVARFAGFESTLEEANERLREPEKLKPQRMELLGVNQVQAGAKPAELFRPTQRHTGSY